MSGRVTLQQLTYFVAAVSHGSFSSAAQGLHVAQPSLSEQIRRLERHLGVTLFVRTNRRLMLTEAGRLFLPRAEAALEAAEQAVDSVRSVRTLSGGMVSFGTFSSAHHFLLTDLVTQFRRRYPEMRLRIVGRNSSEVVEAVRDGRLEAGLVALPIADQGLDVTPPVWTAEVVYASADPAHLTGPVSTEQLAAAPLVLPEAGWGVQDPTRRQLSERARAAGVSIEPTVEVELPSAVLDLAARGVGDTVVSRPLLVALGYADRLGCVPLDPPMHETFAFVTRRGVPVSPASAALITMAANLLRRLSV